MRKLIIFLMKGLSLSIPLSALALGGFGGHSPVFAWIGMVLGLPWNVPALLVALGTVLSNHGLVGPRSIELSIVWGSISLSVNCSFLVSGMQRLFTNRHPRTLEQ